MASARDADMKKYCDSMFDVLTDAKTSILELVGCIDQMQGGQRDLIKAHSGHLRDIANTIDWKLEILTKACPADWTKYSKGAESASVKVSEKFDKEYAAGGDVGG